MPDLSQTSARMIVLDGVDGAGKGVQTQLLLKAFQQAGHNCLLTREPGGSQGAEQIRELLVTGDPERWDDMTELLLMYAARRSHLRDTIWPALEKGTWVICDRYADSSRAFQGMAGNLGLQTVEQLHQLVVNDFEPALVLVLDIPESVALDRARLRGGAEDRFERKGDGYHARVRKAFLEIASNGGETYQVIDAEQSIEEVHRQVVETVNHQLSLFLQVVSEGSHG